ncbi:MAG: PH domain-containing protein [Victivallaceae bacterium]|nr:PH domain-containing protein [Victivallaceae bacterium]
MLWNGGKMNMSIVILGMALIPLVIAIRVLHIVLLRKNQFYLVSTRGVASEGGVLTKFNQTLLLNEIQSVSYTQTIIQQILGCGNIVISSAATYRAGMVLVNIDRVKEIYHIINTNR